MSFGRLFTSCFLVGIVSVIYSQEIQLNFGRGDRYVQLDGSQDSISFAVRVETTPANFFVALGSGLATYVQFGEVGRGLRIYRGGDEISHNPNWGTELSKSYRVSIAGGAVSVDGMRVDVGIPVKPVSFGTWACGAFFDFDTTRVEKWVGSWHRVESDDPGDNEPGVIEIVGDKVVAEWDENTEADLAGYKVYRDGEFYASTRLARQNLAGHVTNQVYRLTVTAYDTAGNESRPSDPVLYAVVDTAGLSEPDPCDLDQNGVLDRRDYDLFIKAWRGEGDDDLRRRADVNRDDRITGRDLSICLKSWK